MLQSATDKTPSTRTVSKHVRPIMTEAFYFLFLFLVLSLRYACLFTKNVTKKAYSRFNISGFKRMQAEQNQFDQRKLHYS